MRLLLDSHAFLWWTAEPERLSPRARAACADPDNELLLSVASIWELLIKEALGKLRIGSSVHLLTLDELNSGGISLLPITLEHIWVLEALPPHHRDPFDRMLVAQTRAENLSIISGDHWVQSYGIDYLW